MAETAKDLDLFRAEGPRFIAHDIRFKLVVITLH